VAIRGMLSGGDIILPHACPRVTLNPRDDSSGRGMGLLYVLAGKAHEKVTT
jgi:hypothetical protein